MGRMAHLHLTQADRKSLASHFQPLQLLQASRGALFFGVGDKSESFALAGLVAVQYELCHLLKNIRYDEEHKNHTSTRNENDFLFLLLSGILAV